MANVFSQVGEREPLMPILRAPPFPHGRGKILSRRISQVELAWSDLAVGREVDLQIGRMIIKDGVGGRFWAPPCLMASNIKRCAVFPVNAKLWSVFFETLAKTVTLSELLILVSVRRLAVRSEYQHVLALAKRAGCQIGVAGNAYPIVERVDEIYVAEVNDYAILGLLSGLNVFQITASGTIERVGNRAAAHVTMGTRYSDPFTGLAIGWEEAAHLLSDWRRVIQRNRGVAVCAGVSFWKRRRIAQLLTVGEGSPPFALSASAALRLAGRTGGAIALWPSQAPGRLIARAASAAAAVCRIEDGFIRSSGLGCEFLPPASIILDRRGVYYDPAQPSDLEIILSETVFSHSMKMRARRLIDLLVDRGVSKYAAAGGAFPEGPDRTGLAAMRKQAGQKLILVPGQVADDESVRLGGGAVAGNLALLTRVRTANPDAFIIYRPHPDVTAGHRRGALPDPVRAGLADQVDQGSAIAALVGAVDEVHTLTSLAGFEALLRGRIVVTYGQPFYAGWGLTRDQAPLERRRRRLQLEELVAGALILYPLYVDPATGLPCGPEVLVARLAQPEYWRPSLLTRARRIQGRLRRRWPMGPAAPGFMAGPARP
jgi:capsular polysaccharide export protein